MSLLNWRHLCQTPLLTQLHHPSPPMNDYNIQCSFIVCGGVGVCSWQFLLITLPPYTRSCLSSSFLWFLLKYGFVGRFNIIASFINCPSGDVAMVQETTSLCSPLLGPCLKTLLLVQLLDLHIAEWQANNKGYYNLWTRRRTEQQYSCNL